MAELLDQDRYYFYSYIDEFGQEGFISQPTNLIAIKPSQDITLTFTDTAPTNVGGGDIVKRRIYRTVGAGIDIVDDIPIADTEYVDKKTDFDTIKGTSEFYRVAEGDLDGIVAMPGGFWAAFKKNVVYFSQPYLPYTSPYTLNVEHKIVHLEVTRNKLMIFTEKDVVFAYGNHPSAMQYEILPYKQGLVAKSACCKLNNEVYYASPDGIFMLNGAQGQLISRGLISREYWQESKPEGMYFIAHDDMLWIINTDVDGKSYIFDLANDSAITELKLDFDFSCYLVDHFYDKLLLFDKAGVMYSFSGPNMEIAWTSKIYSYLKPEYWQEIAITANDYSDLKINIYKDGAKVISDMAIMDRNKRQLPDVGRGMEWYFEIIGSCEIYEIKVLDSYIEPVE